MTSMLKRDAMGKYTAQKLSAHISTPPKHREDLFGVLEISKMEVMHTQNPSRMSFM